MMRMPSRQRGLTLVELLVAVSLSVLVALAAVAALVVSRRGFTSVDAASELRDNARFATSMVQRITAQAGFLDNQFAIVPRNASTDLANPDPNVQGFNNASITSNTNPLGTAANDSRGSSCNPQTLGGCSDILAVRYQAQAIPGAAPVGSATVPPSDLSVIDCSGEPLRDAPLNRDDRGVSIFYVAAHRDEPTLMCISGRETVVNGAAQTPVWTDPVPIVQGVESFQVLYGTDAVVRGTAPVASGAAANLPDTVPDRYLRADQLAVSGNAIETNNNWRRVRSVRIGMVLRGPPGSTQERYTSTSVFHPFGIARSASSAADGSALSSANDRGSALTPATSDTRLRHTTTFTIYLHNDQGLCIGTTCAVQ